MDTVVKQPAAANPQATPQQAPATAANPVAAKVPVKPASAPEKTVVKKPVARKPVAKASVEKVVRKAVKATTKTVAKVQAKASAPKASKPRAAKKTVAKDTVKKSASKVAQGAMKKPTAKSVQKAAKPISAEEGLKRMTVALKPGCENEAVLRHSLQVAKLAAQLFDQLGACHALNKIWRERLLWAALLHDFAYNQGKKGHHKAAKKLIEQDVTLPLSAADRPFVALLSRFHRKAVPTVKHRDLVSLPLEERRNVIAASALLRLADGLDYQHDQAVEKLDCAFDKKTLGVLVHANGKVKASIARALKKAKAMFEAKLVINAAKRTVKPLREVKPVVKADAAKPQAKKAPVKKTLAKKVVAAKKTVVKAPASKPVAKKSVAATKATK